MSAANRKLRRQVNVLRRATFEVRQIARRLREEGLNHLADGLVTPAERALRAACEQLAAAEQVAERTRIEARRRERQAKPPSVEGSR